MELLSKTSSFDSIIDVIEMSWSLYSSETALVSSDENITYSELKSKVSLISSILIQNYSDEQIIAISTTRSAQTIVNILAILKAGKTYLPIDSNYPEMRIAQIVEDCGVKCYLKSSLEDVLPLEPVDLNKASTLVLRDETRYTRLAYILYTSGSTGAPKGVCVPHAGIISLIKWQIQESFSGPGVNTLQFTRLSFDISVQEIFSTLCSGGTLHIVEAEEIRDFRLLIQALVDRKIHRIFLPFVALQGIANEAENSKVYPGFLKEVMTCGEQLKSTRAIKDLFLHVKAKLFNQYGPTECTCIVTQLELDENPESWDDLPTIGKAIDGVEAMILDENLALISEVGKTGEVYFSGVCLADGYLNKPELSAKSFFTLESIGKKVYKTGDLGYWTENGEIFFLGRIDDQIKISGIRIETGEIESVAANLAGVSQVAITVNEYEDGQKFLKLFFVSEKENVSEIELIDFLKERLPDYMIPTFCVKMQEFPRTSNGKIDRKELSKHNKVENSNAQNYVKPRNQVEKNLALIWQSILGLDKVGRDDHFFELGGSSLFAQKMAIQISKIFKREFSVTKIYQFPKLSAQAEFLAENETFSRHISLKHKTQKNKDVAVISTSSRFPGAQDSEQFWEVLAEGKESIQFFKLEELEGNEQKIARENPSYIKARGIIEDIKTFDYAFFGLNPKIAAVMDPQHRLFLEVAYEALDSAGYIAEKPSGKVGVFTGCSSNAYYQKNIVFDKNLPQILGPIQIMTVNEKDYMASRVAYQLDLRGPAISVHTACSTSLVAVANAVQSIRNGECDMALAGGSSVAYPIKSGHLFEEGSIMSQDGHCKPFDASASGTLFSDGAGAVLLKDYEQAVADGDPILAVIKGVGINNDGFTKSSFSAPSIAGQSEAIQMALEDAQISPSSISYVEAHGTATPIGDPIEVEGLKMAFGTGVQNQSCAIGSVKGNIGHLNAAAGIAGFIKTVYALNRKTIPASIGYSKPNPAIDFEKTPFYVNSNTSKWESDHLRRAGVSSFGIGGTNCHVVLEEFPIEEKNNSTTENIDQTIFFSAKSEQSLFGYASKLKSFILKKPALDLTQLGYNINKKNPGFNFGTAVNFHDYESLLAGLNSIISGEKPPVKRLGNFNFPVFLFPGQGAQYLNMGRDLYEKEPLFTEVLNQCDLLFSKYLDTSILDLVFSEDPDEKMELRLADTKYTQPVIFSVSYALARLWISKGVIPTALSGHSIGEFVAACIAKVIDLADAVKVVAKRGELISQLQPGSMLSIRNTTEYILTILPKGLSLAAENAPNLCVVSGPTALIEDFASKLGKREIPAKVLRTSHAFHSEMMDPALDQFKDFLSKVKLNNPQIPILSTVTGDWLKDSEATSPDYWTQHMRLPVLFSKAVERLFDEMPEGAFVEVGPGNGLGTLLLQHPDAKTFPIVHSLSRTNEKSETEHFYNQFQLLINKGLRLKWDEIYPESAQVRFAIPTYSFDKKPCWIDVNQNQHSNNGKEENLENQVDDVIQSSTAENLSSYSSSSLTKQLRLILEEASGSDINEQDFELSFYELGLDSLILTQVAFSIKKEFNVQVSFKQLNGELSTPDALLTFLLENSPIQEIKKNPLAEDNTNQKLKTTNLKNFPSNEVRSTQSNGIGKIDQYKGLSQEEIIELKKPFGGVARIEKNTSEVSEVAQIFIENLIKSYNSKTGKSKAYTQQNRKHMADPRVVSGFKPLTKELIYPIVTKFSKGSRLIDLDDNNYLDWLNGFGITLFGHQSEFIKKAITSQISEGIEIGPQNSLAGIISERICRLTNNERVGLCNTGSEAVLGAMRIARTVSHRSLIVCFSGSYHGINDEVLVRAGKSGKSFPAAAGILSENVQQMLVLEYGSEESLRKIGERADEIAAVLVEPIQSRNPEFLPIEFLKSLRILTDKENICLIFDEIITGFRSHIEGVQGMYDLKADLTTYGKVLGGGLPIGVIAGKSKWMDSLDGGFWQYGDESIPEAGVTYFAGTFVRHPLTLATTNAVLDYLEEKGGSFQDDLANLANEVVKGANRIFEKYNVPYYAVNFRSLWLIKVKKEFQYSDLLFTTLRERNIHIWDNYPCYVTDSHTIDDVHFTLEKLEEVIRLLVENEIVEGDLFLTSGQWMSQDNPPFEGARISLNDKGFPIWVREEAYVESNVIKLQSIFL
ncbi:polyketide synthase [Marivirga sp.]|uniref:polyketide synthase n=1 Tax=Marivirga sp. TaxID=2018662 RepID=UPI0025E077B0|nr:polyketide synthase [Marivirga sp.]